MGLGKLIVLEGGNGSGKDTQSKELCQKLTLNGMLIETMAFPRYGNPSCKDVEDYLAGKKGPSSSISPYVSSIYYANDRKAHAPQIKDWLNDGKIVVLDRYIGSNKGHQAGKLSSYEEVDKYLAWLDKLEFEDNKIPKPDLTILLKVPWKIAMDATIKRAKERNSTLDEHEKDENHVKMAYEKYLYVANKEGWEIIDCYPNNTRLGVIDTHKLVYDAVKRIL